MCVYPPFYFECSYANKIVAVAELNGHFGWNVIENLHDFSFQIDLRGIGLASIYNGWPYNWTVKYTSFLELKKKIKQISDLYTETVCCE